MFAASPSPTNGGGLRPPPQRWARRLRRRAHLCGFHVGDGETTNIAKTYAYTYQMCPYFHIFTFLTFVLRRRRGNKLLVNHIYAERLCPA